MAIQVTCSACGQEHQLPDYLAGFSAPCPCGASLSVPREPKGDEGGAPDAGDRTLDLPSGFGQAPRPAQPAPAQPPGDGGERTIDLPAGFGQAPPPEPAPQQSAEHTVDLPNYGTTIDPADLDQTRPPVDLDATTPPLELSNTEANPLVGLPSTKTPMGIEKIDTPDTGEQAITLESPTLYTAHDDDDDAPQDAEPADGARSGNANPFGDASKGSDPMEATARGLPSPATDEEPLSLGASLKGIPTRSQSQGDTQPPPDHDQEFDLPPAPPQNAKRATPAPSPPSADPTPTPPTMPPPGTGSTADPDADPPAADPEGAATGDPTRPAPGIQSTPAPAPMRASGKPRSLSEAGRAAGIDAGDVTAFDPSAHQMPEGGGELVTYLTSPQARERTKAAEYYDRGEAIARGGMGEIFLSKDRYLQREVVMKLMLPGAQTDPIRVHRFVEEAQVTGQLEHPNIVPVHDLGVTPEGHLYFTMKFVQGDALDHVIDEIKRGHPTYVRKYTVVERLNVFRSICNALAFAHSKNVLHRDLKPENIMIGAFGEVLVMDWGLAKVLGNQASATAMAVKSARASSSDDMARTAAGQVFGTPKYMAPEQARGLNDQVDARTDIYSLGAILYELLALRPPIESGSVFEIMFKVGEGDFVPPGAEDDDPDVPVELRGIVLKAMANAPEDRYQSVEALVADIDAYIGGYSVSAHQDSPAAALIKWAKRNKAATAAIAATIIALIVAIIGTREYQARRLEAQAIGLLEKAVADRKTGKLKEAQVNAYQALALAPRNSEVKLELSRIGIAIGQYRRRKEAEARLEALRERLVQSVKTAREQPEPTDSTTRRTWYAYWNRALQSARNLARATDGKVGQEQLIEVARVLAGRYRDDRNFDIAETLIDEAAAAGLSDELIRFERFKLAEAKGQEVKDDQAVVLKQLAAMRKGDPTEASYRAALAEVLKRPRPHVSQVLVPMVFSGNGWEQRLAIEALGELGFTRAKGVVPHASIPFHGDLHHGEYAPRRQDLRGVQAELYDRLYLTWIGELKGGSMARARHTLDPVQALSMRLLSTPVTYANLDRVVRMATALGRLGDARAALPLAVKRWGDGWGTPFWRRSAEAQRALPAARAAAEDGAAADSGAFHRGLVLAARGELEPAVASLQQAIEASPAAGRAPRQHALALVLLAKGDASQARDLAQTARTASADHPRYPLTLARAQAAAGDSAGAMQTLDAVIAAHPAARTADAQRDRAALLLSAGKADAALDALTKAIDADPMALRALQMRARLHGDAERWAAAALDLAEVIHLDPRIALAHADRGRALYQLGYLQRAFDSLDAAIRRDPKLSIAYQYRADCWVRLHDTTNNRRERRHASRMALRDLDRTIALDDSAVDAYYRRGRMAHSSRKWTQAVEDFDRVMQLAPDRLDARLERAKALERYGDLDRAIGDLDMVLAAQPDDREARLLRGELHRGKHYFDKALADFDQLLAADENDHEARLERALTLRRKAAADRARAVAQARQSGDNSKLEAAQATFVRTLREAIDELSTIIRRRPRSPLELYYRGQYRALTGDPEGQITDLEQAIDVSDGSWYERDTASMTVLQHYLNKHNAAAKAGDGAGALAAGKKALKYARTLVELGYPDPQIKNLAKQLERFVKANGG